MSRRNQMLITLAVAVGALVLIFIIIFLINLFSGPAQDVDVPVAPSEVGNPPGLPGASKGPTVEDRLLSNDIQLESNLKATAATFAERFGSYSNESNFSNFDTLQDIMTVKMKAWTQNFKSSQPEYQVGDVYYGIITKSVSIEITVFEKELGRAELILSTQRQEARGSTVNPRTFYQELLLEMVETGAGWKVDSATWQ